MGYAVTTVVISYCNPYQPLVIHRAHHVWFDKYNYRLSIEDKHAPDYLLLQQDPESRSINSDLLNLIPCELVLTSNPFSDTIIITYEIELPTHGNKLVFVYWMMKILQYLISLIQSQFFQTVIDFQHRLNEMCGSFLSMEKSL